MAAPASAAATTASYPDPTKTAKFPVRLTDDRNGRKPDLRFFTARFNHKPSQQTSRKRNVTLAQSPSDPDRYTVSLQDEDDSGTPSTCSYMGHPAAHPDDTAPYVLTFESSSNSFTMHPVQADYDFNLTDAFWEHDEQALAKTYKQIPFAVASHDSAGSDADVDGDDEDDLFGNPFNFRNYVNGIPSSHPVSRPGSAAGTPRVMPAKPKAVEAVSTSTKITPKVTPKATSKTMAKSSTNPEKNAAKKSATATAKSFASKRAPKHDKKDEPASEAAPTAAKPSVPDIQVRRASTRPAPVARVTSHSSDDDDNGFLLVEDDDEAPTQSRRPAVTGSPKPMAPISLSSLVRSASPSSAGVSPAYRPPRPVDSDDDDVFNLGEDSDGSQIARKSDDDVKSFSLGSPVQRPAGEERPNSQVQAHEQHPEPEQEIDLEEDDDEYDFDAAIQEALQSEGEHHDFDEQQKGSVNAPVMTAKDDESESEEE